MPWSQMPPMPQAQARQLGPYLLIGHCPHEVPFGKVPDGQLETQVLLGGSSSRGGVQVTHVTADPAHVLQLVLHAVQTLLAPTNVPAGHVATQVLPLRYGKVDVALHVEHEALPAPKHVRQLDEHVAHAVPLTYAPFGQPVPHEVAPGCTRRDPAHRVHVVLVEHVVQLARHGRHEVPDR